MKLSNLEKTLTTCIEYHEKKQNLTRAKQLKEQLNKVEIKRLENEKNDNLYK